MFCYANEFLALREYPPIQRAIRGAFERVDERFFIANWEADGRHTELAEDFLDAVCDQVDLARVQSGIEIALEARAEFYDALVREHSAGPAGAGS